MGLPSFMVDNGRLGPPDQLPTMRHYAMDACVPEDEGLRIFTLLVNGFFFSLAGLTHPPQWQDNPGHQD